MRKAVFSVLGILAVSTAGVLGALAEWGVTARWQGASVEKAARTAMPAPPAEPAGNPPGDAVPAHSQARMTAPEPGVQDVQAWEQLRHRCEQLLGRTDPDARDRLSPAAFRESFVGATVEFLQLEGAAAADYETHVNLALAGLAVAREDMEATRADVNGDDDGMRQSAARWESFRSAQHGAVRHLLDALEARPRHELLRAQALLWLLRLDHGIQAAAR